MRQPASTVTRTTSVLTLLAPSANDGTTHAGDAAADGEAALVTRAR